MLDVHLLLHPSAVRLPILYRYTSGLLRGPIRAALSDEYGAEIASIALSDAKIALLGAGFNLAPTIYWCDLRGSQASKGLSSTLRVLAESNANLVLAVHADHRPEQYPGWHQLKEQGSIMEEARADADGLASLVRYFALSRSTRCPRSKDDAADTRLLELVRQRLPQTADLAAVRDMVASLQLLLRRPDGLSIINHFLPQVRVKHQVRLELVRAMRSFIAGSDETELVRFVAESSRLATRAISPRSAAQRIYEACERILRRPKAVPAVSAARALAWGALIVAQRGHVVYAGRAEEAPAAARTLSLPTTMDLLARSFARRTAHAQVRADRGSLGLLKISDWSDTDVDLTSFAQALRLCAASDDDGSGPTSGLRRSQDDAPAAPGASTLAWHPRSFEDIVGQHLVIERLRARLRDDQNNGALIITGPPGVGKRSLARVYAKGHLCTAGPDAAPCDRCSECAAFEGGAAFGYGEADARGLSRDDAIPIVAEALRSRAIFGRRSVIVLHNAEDLLCDPDELLKTLEANLNGVLILLSSSAEGFAASLLSRCETHTLSPLPIAQSAQLTARLANGLGLTECPELLDIVATASAGIPCEIERMLLGYLANPNVISNAIDQGWSASVLQFIESELIGLAINNCMIDQNRATAPWVERTKLIVLRCLQPHAYLKDGFLRSVDDAEAARLHARLRSAAEERRTSWRQAYTDALQELGRDFSAPSEVIRAALVPIVCRRHEA